MEQKLLPTIIQGIRMLSKQVVDTTLNILSGIKSRIDTIECDVEREHLQDVYKELSKRLDAIGYKITIKDIEDKPTTSRLTRSWNGSYYYSRD